MHDVFNLSFDEIAKILGKSNANCRQLATRARKHSLIATNSKRLLFKRCCCDSTELQTSSSMKMDKLATALTIDVHAGHIHHLYAIRNPDKLSNLPSEM